jgi:uncharacterized protein YeaO (DUF488 family)
MALRIVRLGSPRQPGEGLRLGTVRRPPRGVRKTEYASQNFYDVWLPDLAPSEELLKSARSVSPPALPGAGGTDADWRAFEKRYRREMNRPEASRLLDLLAALSHTADLSVGCYCADETRCHRSILRQLFEARRARVVG